MINPIIVSDLENEVATLKSQLDDEHNDALMLAVSNERMKERYDDEATKVVRLTAEVGELVSERARYQEQAAAEEAARVRLEALLEREQRDRLVERAASGTEADGLRQQVANVEAQRKEAADKAAMLAEKNAALSTDRERIKLQLELERDMNRPLQRDLENGRRTLFQLETDLAHAAARVAELEDANEALTHRLELSRLDGLGISDLNWQRSVQLEDINRQLKQALDEALTSNGHHIIATATHGEQVEALRDELAALKEQNEMLTHALDDATAAAAAATAASTSAATAAGTAAATAAATAFAAAAAAAAAEQNSAESPDRCSPLPLPSPWPLSHCPCPCPCPRPATSGRTETQASCARSWRA